MAPKGFPFRFYGRQPSDWIEGANDGHTFSVQLEASPDDTTLERIAEAFETGLDRGPARPSPDAWRWSGRFAVFAVGERRPGTSIVAPVADVLAAVHAFAPIRDVVYLNAREGTGRWDKWSVAQGPPDPGPPGLAYLGLFRRAVDPACAAPAPSSAFEAARARVRHRALFESVDAIVAGSARDEGIRLVAYDGPPPAVPPPPAAFQLPAEPFILMDGDHWAPAAGDHPIEAVTVRPVAFVLDRPEASPCGLAWIDAGGARRVAALPEAASAFACSVSSGGARAIVCGRRRIFEVDLDTGVTRELRSPAPREDLLDVAPLQDGGHAILTGKQLLAVRPAGDGFDVLDASRLARASLRSLFGGRAVAVHARDGSPQILGFVHDRWTKLGGVAAPVWARGVVDGRVVVSTHGRCWELAGVAQALARVEARPGRGAATRGNVGKGGRVGTPAMPEVVPTPVNEPRIVAPAKPTDAERARFPPLAIVVRSGTGRLFGRWPRQDESIPVHQRPSDQVGYSESATPTRTAAARTPPGRGTACGSTATTSAAATCRTSARSTRSTASATITA